MKNRATLRRVVESMQSLEVRRLFAVKSFDAIDAANAHAAGCTCSGCCGPALDAAYARNGADHSADWYKPARQVSVDVAGDAAPVFSTNAAGLPLLTSRPDGVGLKVFLDFDGNGSNLPFGLDADDSTFNTAEQAAIYETWRDIVSYFSMFNVNVTTVQPALGGTVFAWHLTSKSISGGYAYVNSLTNSGPTGFNEAGDAVGRHSGIAHEVGHIMGLSHQGEWDKLGVNVTEYTDGFGPRDATIMGVDYATNVRNFIYGRTSSNASDLQSDLAVLANKTASVVGGDGYRPDDFGGTTATAYVVPSNVQRIEAFIERQSDVDVFRVNITSAGIWHFDATPTFESSVSPKLELLDSAGNLIASRDDADQRNQRNNDVEFSLPMTPGTYYVRVSTSGDYSELGEYLLTASPLMPGFESIDVATGLDRGGTASYDPTSGVLTQMGAGTDIWNTADQFRFTFDTLTGDGSITTRVLSLDNTDPNAKAGIMFRASNNASSAFIMVSVKPDGSLEMIRRSSAGASATVVYNAFPGGLARWLRLSRVGSNYTAEYSADGLSWTSTGAAVSATLGTSVLAGFATTSHNTREATYAEFDNISLTGTYGEAAPTYNGLAAPTGLTAAPVTEASTAMTLTWNDVAGETGYAIDRSVDGVTWVRITNSVAANTTTYTDNPGFGSMRWWYRVMAMSGSTVSSPSDKASVVNKPSAPTIPLAAYAVPAISASSGNAIYLNWADVQGDMGYRVERSTDGVNFTFVANTATNINAYNDTSVSTSTGYLYRITPLTNVGNGTAASLTFEAGTRWTSSNFRTVSRGPTNMTLAWNDFANETSYRIERTTNGVTGWSTIANLPANQTSWVDTAVSQLNEYYYRIVADLPVSEILSSTIAFAASLPNIALPVGWESSDVGTVGGWGIAGSTNGGTTYKVIGGGTNIGSSPDSFHYLYQPLVGNGSITVRVDSQKNNDIDDNAEAGIMIRESLNPNAPYAFVNVEPGRGGRTDFETRTSAGAGSSNINGPEIRAPIWMRLTRTGTTFTAEYSTNGSAWTVIGTRTISMSAASPIYIGMAVSAIESNLMSNAVFSSVALTGDTSANLRPTILSPAYASPSRVTGKTTNLTVAGGDDAGENTLTYTWSTLSVPTGLATPTFNINGTNAAKNAVATFYGAGTYTFRVTITDTNGLTAISDVNVTVLATLTSLAISPADVNLAPGATQAFTASGQDQFGNPMTAATPTWSASAGTIDASGNFTAPQNAGAVTITATAGSLVGTTTVLVALTSTTPAYLVATSPHKITIGFNGNVSASLTASDFVLTNIGMSQVIPTSDLAVNYDAATNTATLSYLPGVLPDGNYTLTLQAADVTLASGQALSEAVTFNFGFYRGDLNGDELVNFSDLLILAQNYGLSDRTYLQGDINYDGTVNFSDLLFLAQRYGTALVQASPLAAVTPTTTKKRAGGDASSSATAGVIR